MQRLEKLANWDELTHLYSRHFGMRTLQEWMDEHLHFTLCFLDLDNLKYVNDTFGHMEGDAYICRAADMLRNFREGAVASRLGGETPADENGCLLVRESDALHFGTRSGEIGILAYKAEALARQNEAGGPDALTATTVGGVS